METDAGINTSDRQSTDKGETTQGKTMEGMKNVPVSTTDTPLSVADIQSSVTDIQSSVTDSQSSMTDIQSSVTDKPLPITNLPLPVTGVLLSAPKGPLPATNVPIPPADVPLPPTDILFSTTDSPLCDANKPLSVPNTSVQDSLLPENLAAKASVEHLENSKSKIVSLQEDKVLEEETGEHSKDSQDLEKQKQEKANPNIDSGATEGVKPPAIVDAVKVSSGDQHKSSSVQDDVNREDSNCTPVEVSMPLPSHFASKETSTEINEKSTPNLVEANEPAAGTDKTPEFTVCKANTHDKIEKAELSNAGQNVRIVSPLIDDNVEKSTKPTQEPVRDVHTSVHISEPAEKRDQCKLTLSRGFDGNNSLNHTPKVSATSSSPCLFYLSISSSNTSSTATSVVTASPGSKYKESLQKVIDSCKAKLGIDDQNVENDVVVLEGDDEDDSIIVSDNELDDDDSDVLLMDIDEHSEDPSGSAPTDVANCATEKQSCGDSSPLTEPSLINPTAGNVGLSEAIISSENHAKSTTTSSDKSVSSTLAPDSSLNDDFLVNPATGECEPLRTILDSKIPAKNTIISSEKGIPSSLPLGNEKAKTAKLDNNIDSGKAGISTNSTVFSNNTVASSFKEKDGNLYPTKETPFDTGFVSVISRNQDKTSGSVITESSTNKKTDSNPAVSVQSPSLDKTINSVSNEQTSQIRPEDKTLLKQAAIKHSAEPPESAEETSFTSLVDDDEDQDDSCVDDNMTLNMEVVCSDGPDEDSDDDIVSDDEVIRATSTSGVDKNSGSKTHVSSRNCLQATALKPGRVIILGNQNSRDNSSAFGNYTNLRGALVTPNSSLTILQHSRKSPSPPTSKASASSDKIRGSSSYHLTSTVSKLSGSTEVSGVLLQKTLPRILSSTHKRKAPDTTLLYKDCNYDDHAGFRSEDHGDDSGVVERISRSARDKPAENPHTVELNENGGLAESHLDPTTGQ